MILGVSPKVDYAFKHMLGRKATRPILADVLNKVLNRPPGHLLSEIEILNPFNPKEAFDDKLSIVDIKARDQAGWMYNIEMQLLPYLDYEKRILYYASKMYQQQLHEGDEYYKLSPTISISFLDHVLFPHVPDYHLRFRLLEETHRFPLTEDMEFHILELPKFTKSASELTDGLDIWLYFLRNAEMMDTDALPAVLQQQPLVLRAIEELKMLTQDDLERERYESRRKLRLDEKSQIEGARRQGRQEGFTAGEKIGQIHAYEQMLRRPETPTDDLTRLSLHELSNLATQLQEQVLQNR